MGSTENSLTLIMQSTEKHCTSSDMAKVLDGTGISPTRFAKVAKTAIINHPQPNQLTEADRTSVYAALTKAATLGLLPDGVEGAIVVYNTKVGNAWVRKCQFQPMVQGMIKLARRSGLIADIGAHVVYKNDSFQYRAGIDKVPQHTADWFGDRGEPIGVWAYIKLTDGTYLRPTMLTRERVMKIAQASKISKNYDPNEGAFWESWWEKAAIRNVLKYAPKDDRIEMAATAGTDDEFEFEQPVDATPDAKPEPPKKPAKRKTRAASKVSAKVAEPEPEITPEPPPHMDDAPLHDDDGVIIDADSDFVKEIEVPV